MPTKTQKQQTDDRFIQVHAQALADKNDVLSAIETRMSKLGADHDLLIKINANVQNITSDVAKLSVCLSGPDGNNGIISQIAGNQVEIKQLRDDVDANARNTHIWGGGNLLTILGAYIAIWLRK